MISDLDELVLKCRDEKARTYLAEAVASYKAGAYRAAIVGTWIAVCFDIIDKLRELALSGDREAEQQVAMLEKTRSSNDVSKALSFERGLLGLARDKFELISHLEYVDLERVQTDRNRCAHPSLTAEEQAYAPSAELARAHIHAAVHHLLQHYPVQGKYALDRLFKEVSSDLFPTSKDKAVTALSSGPLRRPRESLARNFVVALLKRLLVEGVSGTASLQTRAALKATMSMHRAHAEKSVAECLSGLVRSVDDGNLRRVVLLLYSIPECWNFLAEDVRLRLKTFVGAFSSDDFDYVNIALEVPSLKPEALHRIQRATFAEIRAATFFEVPNEVLDRAIDLFLGSKSFDSANASARYLAKVADDLSESHMRRILTKAKENSEVTGSFGLTDVIDALRKTKRIQAGEFDALLNENGLEKFLPENDDNIPF